MPVFQAGRSRPPRVVSPSMEPRPHPLRLPAGEAPEPSEPPEASAADADWQDCRACLAGAEPACVRLLKRYEEEIARQMWRFSRDRAVCEELVQEVMVEAYLSLGRYERRGVPFLHWLRVLATRVGYRYWKSEARRRKGTPPAAAAEAETRDAEPDESAAAAAMLHALLARLPAADRLVLTLAYFEDATARQIAERTGWNLAVVKMRTHRARQKLRKLIEAEGLTDRLLGEIHGPA